MAGRQIRPIRNALPRKFHGATQTQGIGREAHGNSLTVPSLAEHAPAGRVRGKASPCRLLRAPAADGPRTRPPRLAVTPITIHHHRSPADLTCSSRNPAKPTTAPAPAGRERTLRRQPTPPEPRNPPPRSPSPSSCLALPHPPLLFFFLNATHPPLLPFFFSSLSSRLRPPRPFTRLASRTVL